MLRAAILSGHPTARSRRLAAFGVLRAVATACAIPAIGVVAFVQFRCWAEQLLVRSRVTAGALAAIEQRPSNSGVSPPGVVAMPSVPEVIADALKWQPPVAEGHPSPLDNRAALPIVSGDHILGSQRAPITLMVFGDFQCRYAMHTLRMLTRRVEAQPAQYRLVWRQRPLDIHPEAAAVAAEAEALAAHSGERAFWQLLRALSHLRGNATLGNARAIAQALRDGSVSGDAKSPRRALAQLESDERIAAAYAIHVSPTVFLNGLRLEGDLVEGEFNEVIDEELSAVHELLEEPVPQAKVYSIRVHANLLELDSE